MLSHFVSCCHILCHIVTYCVMLSHFVSCCHILCHVVTYCVMLSHFVSCCHILCHIVTFCVILSHAMTCCETLLCQKLQYSWIVPDFLLGRKEVLVTLGPLPLQPLVNDVEEEVLALQVLWSQPIPVLLDVVLVIQKKSMLSNFVTLLKR
jgi:hypothetical protein